MTPLAPFEIPSFKTKYNIPDDVEIKVAGKDEPLIGTRERISIPIRAITEGGVRFPLDPLLLWVLSAMKLCPIQCCPNFFKIMMGVAALNRLLNLSLGLWEILYYYIIKSTGDNYYLAVRKKERYLVTHLPDSNKGHENGVVFVSGNWEYAAGVTPSYRCPYEKGAPGSCLFCSFILVCLFIL